MIEQMILVVVGWALGLITALVSQWYSDRLERKRIYMEMKLQRDQALEVKAGDWSQTHALARLGKIVERQLPQLAPVLRPLPSATLQIVESADEWKKGDQFRVERVGAVIGSHGDCDVHLPEPHVAEFHARIIIADEVFVLEYLGADSPVLLNGEDLYSPRVLHDGDSIRVGSVTLKFQSHLQSE